MTTCILPASARASALLVKPLLFVGGKGGVGKTTLAAGIALAMAERWPSRKVLLLSTDPAHSLRDALGLAGPACWEVQEGDPALPSDQQAGPARRVVVWQGQLAGRNRPNLEVVELDAAGFFAGFRAKHREGLRKIALRGTFLDEEDLGRFLDLGFPGLDELAGLEVVARTLKAGTVDQIVVDTAPTGHTLRLLTMPGVIAQWKGALDVLLNKHRVMARLYAGTYRRDEADSLIAALDDIVVVVRAALADPRRTAFVPVMNADALSLYETLRLLTALRDVGVSAPCVVVNRLGRPSGKCARCAKRRRDETAWVEKARRQIRPPLIEVPSFAMDLAGAEKLEALGRFVLGWGPEPVEERPSGPACDARPEAVETPRKVDVARSHVLGDASLYLVCGKGGGGKTTVACALALWLRSQARGPTLLFSTDPAHSVSDALDIKIGAHPTRVVDGLDAVQINPDERMDQLREIYRREVGAFFESLCESTAVQDVLDHQAMDRLIDLSPAGLDEIMSLVDLARHFREGKYATYVVDTAPTGHFLRLMEMPGVMRAWLRALFEVLLKYKGFFRGEGLQEYLVDLSKGVRTLQEMLRDRNRTLIVPVAIPATMSLEETRDLLRGTGRLGLSVGAGVLNHITRRADGPASWPCQPASWPCQPASWPCQCRVCARQASVSQAFIERYREAFAGLPFLQLEEQMEAPVGIARLEAIGLELFGRQERRA